MSTPERTEERERISITGRWAGPLTALLLGVGVGGGVIARGDTGYGVFIVCLMSAYALFLAFGNRRSETVALMSGAPDDERRHSISLRAHAFTGNVLLIVVVGGFIVQLLRGEDATVWSGLCAVGGLSWLAALVYNVRRSRG